MVAVRSILPSPSLTEPYDALQADVPLTAVRSMPPSPNLTEPYDTLQADVHRQLLGACRQLLIWQRHMMHCGQMDNDSC